MISKRAVGPVEPGAAVDPVPVLPSPVDEIAVVSSPGLPSSVAEIAVAANTTNIKRKASHLGRRLCGWSCRMGMAGAGLFCLAG